MTLKSNFNTGDEFQASDENEVAAEVNSLDPANKGTIVTGDGTGGVKQIAVGEDYQVLQANSGQAGGLGWGTLGSRGVTVTVAASNSASITQLGVNADYVCTGSNDDVTIQSAVAALGSSGGTVKLLAGSYVFGSGATSFINVNTNTASVTIEGEAPYSSSINIPGGTSAPMAIRMASYGGASHTVRNLQVFGMGTQSTNVAGVWMQCGNPVVQNVKVALVGGHGIILDGAPSASGTSVTAPTVPTVNGLVHNCVVNLVGQAILNGGAPADGILVTSYNGNSVLNANWIQGGTALAAGVLTAVLTSGNNYTSLSCTPLTGAITSGDKLVIAKGGAYGSKVSGGFLIGNYDGTNNDFQVVTASANAVVGATSISVTSFTAANTTDLGATWFVADITKMPTRNGITVDSTHQTNSAHLENCHPYLCHMSALSAYGDVQVIGGEYETCSWANVYMLGIGIGYRQVTGIWSYGNPAAAHIWAQSLQGDSITDNIITGGTSIWGIYAQGGSKSVIANNTISDCVTGYVRFSGNTQCGPIHLNSCDKLQVSGNVIYNTVSSSAVSFIGVYLDSATNTSVTGNNLVGFTGGAPLYDGGSGNRSFNNLGYDPAPVSGPALFHDFSTKPNGAVATGALADSGQAWTASWSPSNVAQATVSSGYLVNPDTAAESSRGFLTAQLSNPVTYMEMNCSFGASGTTNSGAAIMIAWATAMPNGLFSTVPDSPCHLVVQNNFYQLGFWHGGTFVAAEAVSFQTILQGDVHIEVYLDQPNGAAYVVGPDGIVTKFVSTYINTITATYASCEVFQTAANTDKQARIHQFAADSGATKSFTPTADKFYHAREMYVPSFLELHDDFIADASGVPTAATSGQPYVNVNTGAGNATVSNFYLTNTDVSNAASIGQLSAQLITNGTYVEADFFQAAAGTTDTQLLILGIQPTSGLFPANTPVVCFFLDNGYQVYYVDAGGASHLVAVVAYLALQGTANQHVEIFLDSAASNVYIRGADNAINVFNNSNFGSLTGTYATVGISYNNASTDHHINVSKFGAMSGAPVQRWADNKARLLKEVGQALLNAPMTMANKRLPKRVGAVVSSGTPSINTDVLDQFNITGQAVAITSMSANLSGNPGDGDELDIRVHDNGVAQTIAWGAKFTGTLLSTTVPNKTHLQKLKYDAAKALWAGNYADTAGY